MAKSVNITYNLLNITVSYKHEAGRAHVDFIAHEIVYFRNNEPFYEGIGGCGADDKSTNDITKANPYINGSVKWDGCSHVYFGEEGYIHLCGSSDFIRIGEILKSIYQDCYKIGGFDYDLLKS